jgi:hypothetical protein
MPDTVTTTKSTTPKKRRLSDAQLAKMKDDLDALQKRIADDDEQREADDKAAKAKEAKRIDKRRAAAGIRLGRALLAAIRDGDQAASHIIQSLLDRMKSADRKIAEARISSERTGVEPTKEQEFGTKLTAQYADRAEVKKLGGKFNREDKAWYAPPGATLSDFAKWLPKSTTPAMPAG